MSARSSLILSVALNAVLAVALAGLTWLRLRPSKPADRVLRTEAVTAAPAEAPDPTPVASVAVELAAAPRNFHWSAIESDDYRQYIQNLKQSGCPERLIRDLVVADLQELYARRRAAVSAPVWAPWTSHDVRQAGERDHQARLQALDQEHRAVLRELLGFAWEAEGLKAWRDEELIWILLGFATDEQAIKVAGLVQPLENDARQLRERAYGILLPEDEVELRGQAARFESDLAAILTPQQLEEFKLRLQAFVSSILGKGVHFEAAGLTALQAREVIRLSFLKGDLLQEELLDLPEASTSDPGQPSPRAMEFETEVARLLGPQAYAAFARAQDERFREVLGFSQARELPEDVAIKAWEVRQEAEAAAEALRQLPADDPAAGAHLAELEALQESATVALTALFGAQHMQTYVAEQGKWLEHLTGDSGPESQPATDATE